MGASNELPESEELDALYDRFLLRRRVQQVSQAGLLEMLGNGGGRKQVRKKGTSYKSPRVGRSGGDAGDAGQRRPAQAGAKSRALLQSGVSGVACAHEHGLVRCLPPHLQAIALRSPGTQGLQSVDDPAAQPLLTADDFDHTR